MRCIMLMLVLVVSFGCQYDNQYGNPPQMMTVAVEMHYPAKVGRRTLERRVQVPFGSTVLDATKLAAPELYSRQHGDGNDSGYMSPIAHLQRNEADQRTGWVYTVNGHYPSPGPNGMPVVDGDRIVWRYNPL